MPCDVKGADAHAIHRFCALLTARGVERLNYMCDQESAISSMIKKGLALLGKRGEFVGGVPEKSAVGESQSNGRAEQAMQEAEGQIRTMKHALQERIIRRVPSMHPIRKLICRYASIVLNKYAVHDDNTAAYQQLHGKRATERLADCGEVVLVYIPNARRAKLDMMWAAGVYLGTTGTSNGAYIGLPDGNVARSRAITRVRPDVR